MSRVGRLLFERGEEIYNFQGVRRYKDKYDPLWQPRYCAAPHKWSIPWLMADVGLLSSGGVSGLSKRPKKADEPRPAEASPRYRRRRIADPLRWSVGLPSADQAPCSR